MNKFYGFFKNYVHLYMVSNFVNQYKKALDAYYFENKDKGMQTKSTWIILKTYQKIEEHAALVYTKKIFMIF